MASYVAEAGDFTRDTNYIETRITADGRDGYPVEPGRYRLIAARACPWANRAIIVRRLLGLEDVISIGFCGPTHDERSWTFDLDPGGVDPVLEHPAPAGGVLQAVPRLPERHHRPGDRRRPDGRGRHQRLRADDPGLLDGVDARTTATARLSCTPSALRAEIDEVSRARLHARSTTASTGAVRRLQQAYDAAYDRLFAALDWLSDRLAKQRYLVGDTITEADVRLFTTLARFDPVYHGHFKCNRRS